MLTWTAAGAVQCPTTLQIRVQRAYPGRVRAGAPVPTRSMDPVELRQNLEHFTEGMKGPRTRPCTTLVLSGVGVASREDVPELIDRARAWGVGTVVLHAGVEDLESFDASRFEGRVHRMVVPVQPGRGGAALQHGRRVIAASQEHGMVVTASTQLTALAVPRLETVGRVIRSVGPSSAVFTYPFPISGNTASEVPGVRAPVQALERVVGPLETAGLQVDLKGLPICYLGALARRVRRTSNRWYVDADHQCGDALMFFPDVVAFTKTEACRFCSADASCDGFFATYLRRSGFPPLRSVD